MGTLDPDLTHACKNTDVIDQWFSKWGPRFPGGPPGGARGASGNQRGDDKKSTNVKIIKIKLKYIFKINIIEIKYI